MYQVQIILRETQQQHGIGTYELPVMPRIGESLQAAQPEKSTHHEVRILDVFYPAYPPKQRPAGIVDAILVVERRDPLVSREQQESDAQWELAVQMAQENTPEA